MVWYNNVVEFKKISSGFKRVKEDIGKIFNLLAQNSKKIETLEREIKLLREQVVLNSQVIIENNENKRVVGNKDSKKFHYDNCPFAKRIKQTNLVGFNDIEDAVKHGFDECSCIREY